MKHTRLFFLVVAALFLAACHDEPVDVTPTDSTDEQAQDTIVQELPNSEWWECVHINFYDIDEADTILLNISWDSGQFYAHSNMSQHNNALALNMLMNFHMSNDTMYWDYLDVDPSYLSWIISFTSDTLMKMDYMYRGGPAIPFNITYYFSYLGRSN